MSYRGFPGSTSGKEPMQETEETRVWPLVWRDPLEEGTATHSSILSWRISLKEEPGRLQSIELDKTEAT